ncbi:hypothetical protein AAGC94_19635 [Clostridium sporogenes]|uniref:Iron-only hydrogenase system regulator n=1 Tax=Clostridium sporogenes TaxID=1509 RepID=A0A7X5P6Y0_CLOSG|nr:MULTISPECIES: hypothetical protein [Clostridium]AJD30730.1 hypothetical protein T258_619 [Clostridium botulinum Prevot_594]AKC62575.1 hypothetical protein CLSPO_c18550 [Clostridium sporogenes]AKJ89835.1 hypothetical protein CLSPOx_09330 [Clostridium sporogenes]AVQ47498.1 hypothetical protein C7M60_17695 [Clostridium botulinum]AVQ49988.1 hypothetical protein C7M58_11875 [Clostridium botulinum]
MFSIMAIKISPRNEIAPKVQEILTRNGCIIKTRLGLHEATNDSCSKCGLVLLELLNNKKEDIENLSKDLTSLEGVSVKLLEI